MKLKKLLKHIGAYENIIIIINEDDEPVYEGTRLNIPWSLLDLPLDTEKFSGSIYSNIKNKHSYIKIFLKEE